MLSRHLVNTKLNNQQLVRTLFQEILMEGLITTLYQPIVEFKTGVILGYEALSRGPENTIFSSPLKLIEVAHETKQLWDLEMLFRFKALEKAHRLKKGQLMFINVDPDVIKSPGFQTGLTQENLSSLGINREMIVFEITERTAIHDYQAFVKVLDHYRNQGYSIAIDDAGAGYAGLRSIHEIRPEYIKIDMDLIRDIDKDNFKQSLIRAFVEALSGTGIRLIAEGIETEEELKTLMLLGVHAGQGYYLGRPHADFCACDPEVTNKIMGFRKLAENLMDFTQDYHYISHLISTSHVEMTYESHEPCSAVKAHMESESLMSIVITQQQQPIGLITKAALDAKLSGPYGFSLYVNRAVKHVMKTEPLIVDAYTPIHIVAKRAMEREDSALYDDIIVVKCNAVVGLVPMKRIIEYTLTYEKRAAKELNPLSGLPGNTIINRVLSDVLVYIADLGVLYVDINDFKVYNDLYGFEKGDQMILAVCDLLKEEVKARFAYGSFIGHIGGDDFIVLVEGGYDVALEVANAIAEGFNVLRNQFYDQLHLDTGSVVAEDRYGTLRAFPLASLAVAGLHGNLSRFEDVASFSETLGQLKKYAKKMNGSYVHVQQMQDFVSETT